MSLTYLRPERESPLRQGEILQDVWELRSRDPAKEPVEGSDPKFEPIHHPLTIIVAAACDLEQDFKVRFPAGVHDVAPTPETLELRPEIMPYVTMCALVDEEEIKSASKLNSDLFRRVRKNDHGRYHKLRPGRIGVWSNMTIDKPLFLDFRKAIALPTDGVYSAINSGHVQRAAVLPASFVQDLVQRYHAYLSRVGLPDEIVPNAPKGQPIPPPSH